MDDQDKRIHDILGNESERSRQNSIKYLEYLKTSIKKPCRLTGMEDFPWEEKYIIGGWDKKEYEELKKNNPSYTDEYELIEFILPESGDDEILAIVRRISDKMTFEIGISWLECTDKESVNYLLIEDCASWHVNY
jgi:hypothetical protein